jgi:RNA polymerase sigma-70 factor (ECF subfamily)
LRVVLLQLGDLGMIDSAALGAWGDLEAKLRPFIARRVPAGADVDDVLQDVFLRMHRGLAGLRDRERLGPWVYQIARNASIDHARSSARHQVEESNGLEAFPHSAEDDRSTERELASQIATFVALLPSPYREALTLTELQGMTQGQAANMLGISLSGMKSRVQRGRQRLRAALEECCHIALDARRRVVGCDPRSDGRVPDGCCANADDPSGS